RELVKRDEYAPILIVPRERVQRASHGRESEPLQEPRSLRADALEVLEGRVQTGAGLCVGEGGSGPGVHAAFRATVGRWGIRGGLVSPRPSWYRRASPGCKSGPGTTQRAPCRGGTPCDLPRGVRHGSALRCLREGARRGSQDQP